MDHGAVAAAGTVVLRIGPGGVLGRRAREQPSGNTHGSSWMRPSAPGCPAADWLTMQLRDLTGAGVGGIYATGRFRWRPTSRYHLVGPRTGRRSRALPCRWRFDAPALARCIAGLPDHESGRPRPRPVAAWTRFGVVALSYRAAHLPRRSAGRSAGHHRIRCLLLYRGEFYPPARLSRRADATTFFGVSAAQQVETIVRQRRWPRADRRGASGSRGLAGGGGGLRAGRRDVEWSGSGTTTTPSTRLTAPTAGSGG